MFVRSLLLLASLGGLTLVFLRPANGTPDRDAPAQGMEVLARGPLHEAFAQPLQANPQPGPVIPRQPPRPLEELPPEQKPQGAVWVPGYWQWDEERSDFIWVSGTWRIPPPGRQWVPGGYRQVENGFQWSSGAWMPENQQGLQLLPPPPASVENGPSSPARDENSMYIPGTWLYRQTGYLWRPGFWTDFRPDLVWTPAQYYWTPAGSLFVDGYWDYPLFNRGLPFAPVWFGGGLWNQPGFCFTPSYAVSCNFLPTALFARPAWRHYYFGDYYGTTFLRTGYTPWINYCWRPACYDPLWLHCGCRFGAGWQRNLTTLYANRTGGQAILPPRTLQQQNTLIPRLGATNVTNLQALAPLSQAGQHGVRLSPVTPAERQQVHRNGQQSHDLGTQRQRLESHTSTLRAGPLPAPSHLPSNPVHGLPTPLGHSPNTSGFHGPSHTPSHHSSSSVPVAPHTMPHGAGPVHSAHPPLHHSGAPRQR